MRLLSVPTIIGALIGMLFFSQCCKAAIPEGQTVVLCGQDAAEYPLKSGWQDFAYCENFHLIMVKELKVKGKIKYERFPLENRIYHRDETGLPCDFSVYKCEVEHNQGGGFNENDGHCDKRAATEYYESKLEKRTEISAAPSDVLAAFLAGASYERERTITLIVELVDLCATPGDSIDGLAQAICFSLDKYKDFR